MRNGNAKPCLFGDDLVSNTKNVQLLLSLEKWEDVLRDIEEKIMPGVTHWQHPNFHAYYPVSNSYPALCADMLSDAIGGVGFSWASSPASTELEMLVMDWMGKMLGLPENFLFSSKCQGGGVIQGSASEATLVAMLSARAKAFKKYSTNPLGTKQKSLELVAYCSDQAHSSVERAGLLSAVRTTQVKADKSLRMTGEALREKIEKDKQAGLLPFFVCATIGTTSTCAFDDLSTIGPVCREFGLWLHVDAAYAGSACICPEYRYLLNGIEHTDSFNFNPHMWLLVNYDCSCIWFKNSADVVQAFNVDPLYLKHDHQGHVPDYRHWQIALGGRFRSLKLWFVLRLFGIEQLQAHIRTQVGLAKRFEELVNGDSRFEVAFPVNMGLVCFRLSDKCNDDNRYLLRKINSDGRIHITPSEANGQYFMRFVICSPVTEEKHVTFAWHVISEIADSAFTTGKSKQLLHSNA